MRQFPSVCWYTTSRAQAYREFSRLQLRARLHKRTWLALQYLGSGAAALCASKGTDIAKAELGELVNCALGGQEDSRIR